MCPVARDESRERWCCAAPRRRHRPPGTAEASAPHRGAVDAGIVWRRFRVGSARRRENAACGGRAAPRERPPLHPAHGNTRVPRSEPLAASAPAVGQHARSDPTAARPGRTRRMRARPVAPASPEVGCRGRPRTGRPDPPEVVSRSAGERLQAVPVPWSILPGCCHRDAGASHTPTPTSLSMNVLWSMTTSARLRSPSRPSGCRAGRCGDPHAGRSGVVDDRAARDPVEQVRPMTTCARPASRGDEASAGPCRPSSAGSEGQGRLPPGHDDPSSTMS
jgi:hypothetical protein